ncbi:unnamed protein product [Effrenium voratum]|nr:unnamed protein product [Effrenium voratum]
MEQAEYAKVIVRAFRKFDLNGDGRISQEELKRIMMLLDPSFTREDLDSIFVDADPSKDGFVSFEEFAHWATEPQGIFGMVPANAAVVMSKEERAAVRIQAAARGRATRRRPVKKRECLEMPEVQAISLAELWEGLAFERGSLRQRLDLYELISGFNGCKRTGLSLDLGYILAPEALRQDLFPEEVNHLALMICAKGARPLTEAEAFEEIAQIKEHVRDLPAIRVEEVMASRHFRDLVRLISALMGVASPVIAFQWYWFEFALFQPTVEVLELLLTNTVYTKSRLQVIAHRQGLDSESELKGKLLGLPFALRDLMLLVYNGGLAAHAELPSMHPSEVQALWPRLMRQMPALLQRHGGIRKAVAAGRMWQEQDELAPLESAPKDGRRPSKDRRPSGSAAGAGKEQDHERVSLTGVQEFSVLLEKLYENEKLKSRFSSPLEMIVSSVLHAQSCGHIWEEEKFSEAGAPLKF